MILKLVTEPSLTLNSMLKVEVDGKSTRFYRESTPHGDFYKTRNPETKELEMVSDEMEKQLEKFFEKIDSEWKPFLKANS